MLSRITLFTAVLAICGGLFTVGGIVVPIKDAHAGKYGDKDKKCPKPARYRTKDDKCVAAGVSRKAGIKAFKARAKAAAKKEQKKAKHKEWLAWKKQKDAAEKKEAEKKKAEEKAKHKEWLAWKKAEKEAEKRAKEAK